MNRNLNLRNPAPGSTIEVNDGVVTVEGLGRFPFATDPPVGAIPRIDKTSGFVSWILLIPPDMLPSLLGDVFGNFDSNLVQSINGAGVTVVDNVNVLSPYTVQTTDFLVVGDMTSAVVDLPPANNGKQVIALKCRNGFSGMSVVPNGTDQIESSGPVTLNSSDWMILVSDGVSYWYQIALSPTLYALGGELQGTISNAQVKPTSSYRRIMMLTGPGGP